MPITPTQLPPEMAPDARDGRDDGQSQAPGRGVHVVNCVYYRDWEIVLIDGDEELVLATFLPATEGHKPGFG
jgi:hypothetical protein